ncbi:MAG: type IV pilus twitching motility protein PilT [Bdellovibrionales bacterium]
MAKLDEFFKFMKEKGGSDLHLSSCEPPMIRLHGEIVRLEYQTLSPADVQALVFEILTEKQKKLFIENWELDCSYAVEGVGRFRCNVLMQRRGLSAVFRIIPEIVPSCQDLNLPSSLLDMINVHRGLILVTGPTGSGKSTTLAALIDHINANEACHILTIEDPIEFVHPNKKSLVTQREVSSHTKSFANALKASLREDPDIILVGELRDLETIQLAMTAAETGHVVFGTLHTNSAAKTVDRIIDVFPQEQQEQVRVMLSESLRGVIAQTLLPRADKKGRVAGLEVLVNTGAVANLIREGKTFQIGSAMQIGRGTGMFTFETHLMELVQKGLISNETALSFLGKSVATKPSGGPVSGTGMTGGGPPAPKPMMPPPAAVPKPAGIPPIPGIKKPA